MAEITLLGGWAKRGSRASAACRRCVVSGRAEATAPARTGRAPSIGQQRLGIFEVGRLWIEGKCGLLVLFAMNVPRKQRQLEDGPRARDRGLGNMMVRLAVVGVKGSARAGGGG